MGQTDLSSGVGAGFALQLDGGMDLDVAALRRDGNGNGSNGSVYALDASYDRSSDGRGLFLAIGHEEAASDGTASGNLSMGIGHVSEYGRNSTRKRGARATVGGGRPDRIDLFAEVASGRNALSMSFGQPVGGEAEASWAVQFQF